MIIIENVVGESDMKFLSLDKLQFFYFRGTGSNNLRELKSIAI
jgi:hypothetical protein